ncbi:MAG: VOC family protein [Acidobacteriota bacterium]
MIKRIDHISIAVKNLGSEIPKWRDVLGLKLLKVEKVLSQKVEVAFFENGLELTSPLDENSPVHKFLEKRGEGLHHICFEVDDLEGSVKKICEAGFEKIEASRKGADDSEVAFFRPSNFSGVLVELKQKKR